MRTLAVVLFGVICCVGCAACEECRNCGDCRVRRDDVKRGIDDHGDDSGIRIESARYGRDDVWVDVTPQVRGLVNGDTLVLPRDLHKTLNVDPVPNRMKYVDMTIIIDGRVVEMTVGDSLHVTPLRLRAGSGGGAGRVGGDATTRPQ